MELSDKAWNRESALEVQAEIDAANTVTDEMMKAGKGALFNVYQRLSGNVFPEQALFEEVNEIIVRSIIEAALKAQYESRKR